MILKGKMIEVGLYDRTDRVSPGAGSGVRISIGGRVCIVPLTNEQLMRLGGHLDEEIEIVLRTAAARRRAVTITGMESEGGKAGLTATTLEAGALLISDEHATTVVKAWQASQGIGPRFEVEIEDAEVITAGRIASLRQVPR